MSERLIQTTRALCLSAALLIPSNANSAGWESLPPLPEPNGGFVCGAHGSRIVIVGGTSWEGGTKNWLRAVQAYDPAKKKWEKVEDFPEGPIAYGVAFQKTGTDGTKDFTFAGGSNGSQTLKILGGVETKTVSISELPDTLVLSAGGVIDGTRLIVGGTNDAANIAGSQRSACSFAIINYRWSVKKLPDYPGRPFCVAASAVAGDELFVFGGANWDASAGAVINANEAHAFSLRTNTWRKLKPLPFAVRGLTGVALDHKRIYLAGGYKSDPEGFTDDALIYDVKSDSYSPAKPLPYAAMVGLVALDGFVYCIGGEDKQKHRTDKFFRIKLGELTP